MPEYFATLGVPILDGRDFADTDTLETPPVAILSQRAGELLFQGEYPLGQQVRWGVDPYFWATVIGIVPNTTWHQADDGGVEYYFHHGQLGATRSDIVATVLSNGAGIAAVGTVCGLLVALAMGSYLDALLFRVSRFDLVTFSSVPIVICVVTLIACALSAWRASRVDRSFTDTVTLAPE